MATTSVRSGDGRAASTVSSPRVRRVPNTAATWPWGQLRSMASCARAFTSVSPRKMRRTASIAAGGRCDRLASVRLRVVVPSRCDSRNKIAGGEVRLGSVSIYMAAIYSTLHSYTSAILPYLHGRIPPELSFTHIQ